MAEAYRGGNKLSRKLKELASAGAAHLRVGFLENRTYSNTQVPVAQVAFWQEFGNALVPPRSFFRPLIAAKKAEWAEAITTMLKTGMGLDDVLESMGALISMQLKQSIRLTVQTPLSPVTLMLRKMRDENPDLVTNYSTVIEARRRVAAGEAGASGTRAKPLIDTAYLLNSPSFEIVEGGADEST